MNRKEKKRLRRRTLHRSKVWVWRHTEYYGGVSTVYKTATLRDYQRQAINAMMDIDFSKIEERIASHYLR